MRLNRLPSDPQQASNLDVTNASTRRGFLQRLGVTAAATATSAPLVTVGGVSALSALGCMGETEYDQKFESYWKIRADQIEDFHATNFGGIYTTAQSRFPDKVNGHMPVVQSIEGGFITVTVNHGMSIEHWITTIYMRDQTSGRVFYLKEFMPLDVDEGQEKGVTVIAPFPNDVKLFAVYSYCNLHDLWMCDPIAL